MPMHSCRQAQIQLKIIFVIVQVNGNTDLFIDDKIIIVRETVLFSYMYNRMQPKTVHMKHKTKVIIIAICCFSTWCMSYNWTEWME